MRVHSVFELAAEKVVVQPARIVQLPGIDLAETAQKHLLRLVPALDGVETLVSPLVIPAAVAQSRGTHGILLQLPLPVLVEQRLEVARRICKHARR